MHHFFSVFLFSEMLYWFYTKKQYEYW